MDAEGKSVGEGPQSGGPQTDTSEGTANTAVVRKTCPPVGVVCCPVRSNQKPCCKPRNGLPTEFPPGEGPAEMPELVDVDILVRLKEAYEKTHGNMFNRSLMKKYLSRPVFDDLKYKKTKDGSTLLDVIRSGAKRPESVVGAYAPDAQAYNKFDKLFNPIIWEYHKGFSPSDTHPSTDWGNPKTLPNLDPCEGMVEYVRVSCCRNVVGFPLMRNMTEEQFSKLEKKVITTFDKFEGQFQGDYEPRAGMTKDYYSDLEKNHLIFPDQNPFLEAANATKLSKSRGVFLNKDRTFLVWVGVEDHLQIISLQRGGNIGEVYGRLIKGMSSINMYLKFQKHSRLGYITMCPSNLGNTIRASALVKLPYTGYDDDQLKRKVENFNLEVRSAEGGDTPSKNCVHELSNRRKLGLTEFDSVNEMVFGVKEVIKLERVEQSRSSKKPEEMFEEQKKLQKSKEEEKERDKHRRFARRNPDGQFSEHQDPRIGGKDKKRDRSKEKDKDKRREKRPKDTDKSKDRDKSKESVRDRSRDKERSRERDTSRDREKDRSRDRATPSDRDRDRSRDRDRDRSRDTDRVRSRDTDRVRSREKDRDLSRDRDRVRSRDKDRDLSRDRDRVRSRDRSTPRDKDRVRSREGDRVRSGDRERDRTRQKNMEKLRDMDSSRDKEKRPRTADQGEKSDDVSRKKKPPKDQDKGDEGKKKKEKKGEKAKSKGTKKDEEEKTGGDKKKDKESKKKQKKEKIKDEDDRRDEDRIKERGRRREKEKQRKKEEKDKNNSSKPRFLYSSGSEGSKEKK